MSVTRISVQQYCTLTYDGASEKPIIPVAYIDYYFRTGIHCFYTPVCHDLVRGQLSYPPVPPGLDTSDAAYTHAHGLVATLLRADKALPRLIKVLQSASTGSAASTIQIAQQAITAASEAQNVPRGDPREADLDHLASWWVSLFSAVCDRLSGGIQTCVWTQMDVPHDHSIALQRGWVCDFLDVHRHVLRYDNRLQSSDLPSIWYGTEACPVPTECYVKRNISGLHLVADDSKAFGFWFRLLSLIEPIDVAKNIQAAHALGTADAQGVWQLGTVCAVSRWAMRALTVLKPKHEATEFAHAYERVWNNVGALHQATRDASTMDIATLGSLAKDVFALSQLSKTHPHNEFSMESPTVMAMLDFLSDVERGELKNTMGMIMPQELPTAMQ